MPTTITKSIGSGGGRDYATIYDFFAAIPSDLTATDEIWVGEFYNDSEFNLGTTGFSLSGKTTDSNRYIILRAAAGHSFKDHADRNTNPLRYDATKGVGFTTTKYGNSGFSISVPYTRVEGIQFEHVHNPGNDSALAFWSADGALVKNCIVEISGTSGMTNNCTVLGANFRGATAINSAFVIATATSGSCVKGSGQASGYTDLKLYNCTLLCVAGSTGTGYLGSASSTTRVLRNCAVFGFGTFANSGGAAHADNGYNATDLASAIGSNNVTSLTAADQFESLATDGTYDARAKSGSGLVAGTRDATNTADLDIAGRPRNTTTPTIGAWEYTTASGGVNRRLLLGVG